MRIEGMIFAVAAAFFVVMTVIYWAVSLDPTGTTVLGLTGGLSFIIGYYLLFTARRMEARPEDRPDAEISEGAGEVGFFAPHSWWPILVAGAFSVVGAGLIFGTFLLLIGVGLIGVTVSGFVMEYYYGVNRSQSHTLGALEAMGEPATSARKFLGE